MKVPVGRAQLNLPDTDLENLRKLIWACVDKALRVTDMDYNLRAIELHIEDGAVAADLVVGEAWVSTVKAEPKQAKGEPNPDAEIGDDEWFMKV